MNREQLGVGGSFNTIGSFSVNVSRNYAVMFINNRTGGNDPNGRHITPNGAVPQDGIWRHVAAVWDGTNNYVYINGVSRALSTENSGDGWGTTHAIGTFYNESRTFSQPDNVPPDVGQYNFTGSIDEVYVYNRALSQEEVEMLYNMDPLRIPLTKNDYEKCISEADCDGVYDRYVLTAKVWK